MSERGLDPNGTQLTRRQLREAHRRNAPRATAVAVRKRQTADRRRDDAVGPAELLHDPEEDPQLASAPAATTRVRPSRRELREAEQRSRRAKGATGERNGSRAGALRSWPARAAVLTSLAVGTIAVPLSQVTASEEPAPAAEAVSVATRSVLDEIDAAATRQDRRSSGAISALLADSGAANRALVQTSRTLDRENQVCSAVTGEGANGIRAALATDAVVHPLYAGTFNQSSRYGNRVHPIFGGYSMHHGVDYAAPLGTPIMAVADGVVRHAGHGIEGRSDMLIIIEHEVNGETFYSWYVHMYRDGVHVSEGEQVRAGQVIGEVGNNGNSTGPHLHLEIHLDTNGTTTDPSAFLAKHDATTLNSDSCA